MKMPSKKVRAYIYSVAIPVVALLIFYGILTEAAAALWLALVGAVLSLSLARANVYNPEPPEITTGDDDISGGSL